MSIYCKYTCGRVVEIDYRILNQDFKIETRDKYNLILMEKGNLLIEIENKRFNYSAPALVAIKENVRLKLISSYMLLAKAISFEVSFLNVNITYDLINSGKYEEVSENFGFIPLDIFWKRNNSFFGNLPLQSENLIQFREQFHKFDQAIVEQKDKRWSCRARLHLNIILELAHQAYRNYINKQANSYNIKDSNVWVSKILEKIHSDYMHDISLKTLSEYVHINKTTVGTIFKKITGFSVTDYIIKYRIKCACYSLATTQITLKEIAAECGFKRESYFIHQFKAKMEMTPTEFRRKCLEKRKKDFKHKSSLPLA